MQTVALRRGIGYKTRPQLRRLWRTGLGAAVLTIPLFLSGNYLPIPSAKTFPALAKEAAEPLTPEGRETACAPLARLAFYVNGTPATFGMPLSDGNGTLISVREAVLALSGGSAAIAPVGPRDTEIQVVSGGRIWMRIPLLAKTPARASAASDSNSPKAQVADASIPVDEPAAWVVYGGVARPMMDLHALCGLFGAAVNEVGETVQITTPAYWRRALGLDDRNTLPDVLRSLANRPDLGASPPAKTVLLWSRARRPGYLQIYFLGAAASEDYALPEEKTIRPLLGKDPLTEQQITLPDVTAGDPMPWAVSGPQRVFCQATYFEDDPSRQMDLGEDGPNARFARYAVVWSAKNPGADMRKAIKEGRIGPGEWCVVGIRHRVGKVFAPFEIYSAEPKDTAASVADKFAMPPEFLQAVNGLEPGERLLPGEQVAVLKKLDDKSLQELRIASGLPAFETSKPPPAPSNERRIQIEVRQGDTLDSLSQRCGFTVARLREEAGLAVGEELQPGALITIALREGEILPPVPDPVIALPTFTNVGKYMRVDVAVPVYEKSGFYKKDRGKVRATLSKFQRVFVRRSCAELRLSEISFDQPFEGSGYILTRHLTEDAGKTDTMNRPVSPGRRTPSGYEGPIPSVSPQALPKAQQIVKEALKWERVPRYVWGGDDIARGIDCSHFVAAVYRRVGERCPEPPVRNMEQFGAVVHWKPDADARMGDSAFPLPPTKPSQWPQSGDRIIFQSSHPRGRHTGIYIGQFRGMEHAYIHCNGGRKTVSVDELTRTNWRIYKYSCRGNARRRTGSLTAEAAPRDRGIRMAEAKR